MQHLWRLEKAFMKDLLAELPDPKPAVTTVATLLKRLQNKGYVAYRTFGNSREYYPLVSKTAHYGPKLRGIKQLFAGKPAEFASFFTGQAKLNKAELLELQRLIDAQIEQE